MDWGWIIAVIVVGIGIVGIVIVGIVIIGIVGGNRGHKMGDTSHKTDPVESRTHIDIEDSISAITPYICCFNHLLHPIVIINDNLLLAVIFS